METILKILYWLLIVIGLAIFVFILIMFVLFIKNY